MSRVNASLAHDMGKRRVMFLTHTGQPGGAELSLMTYLPQSRLPLLELISLQSSNLWEMLARHVTVRIAPESPLPLQMHWLRKVVRTDPPDLVVANTMKIALVASIVLPRRVPLVYWVRDGLNSESAMTRSSLLLTRYVTVNRVNFFITNSKWTDGTLRAWRKNVLSSVVPSPTGLSRDALAATIPRNGVHSPVRLLYMGRLSPWKAPHVAVEALEHLNRMAESTKFVLTIAGAAQFSKDEAYAAFLRRRVEQSPCAGSIEIVGHVENTRELLARHDIMVHCSVRPEPFGRVLVEAWGAGLPVAATAGGGPALMVTQGRDGETYDPGDATELARCIWRITERFASYSKGALGTAAQYVDDDIITHLDGLLTDWSTPSRRSS